MSPRLLDLFCGAGGAAMGYMRAGFDVVGVDLEPHALFPGEFVQGDALTYPLEGFDVIHASPPCQAHVNMSNRWRGRSATADGHVDLIGPIRERLIASGKPYVIENVLGAPMRSPVLLHGGMFGLGVYRPRLFEVSVPIGSPPAVSPPKESIGVYGKLDGRRLWTRTDGTEQRAAKSVEEGRAAMGIDWMDWHDLTEAIPPAYTEWLGKELLRVLPLNRRAA